ncbi:cytochrome P450 [Crepidotus variabilis]|uniref:Cytochrome P450 n=1 Tax=Crepidotus variabilis TaxID=179855 RepID=A0A9P6JKX0_9AGAR|nr:cytochrome P450 [Crepidotus variabilis]
MSVAYGIEVKPKDDVYIQTAERGVYPLTVAAVPGSFLVDLLPILKYVPAWFPGAGFQTKARQWKRLATDMIELPYAEAKKNIAEGTCPPCFTSMCFEKMNSGTSDDAYREDIIQGAAGTMYAAGSDTTISGVASCILGLLERPDVFKQARADLDRVVKKGHLPDFDDEASLPFITAIVKEVLRWRDIVPIAVPRYLENDDQYKGYRLPAGSIVIPNAWAMLHDESVYPEPFEFKPERFMKDGKINPETRDPAHACWGFGRRICPGRYVGFAALWVSIASIIHVFDIEKERDEQGKPLELSHEYVSGIVWCVYSIVS